MKKFLLTAAAVATLATSSAYAAEDMFYVKGQVGWDKLTKVHGLKSKNGVFLGLGVGYYVMDNVRADLTFDHYIDPEHKGNTSIDGIKLHAKVKSRADTLMVNGFVDLFDVSVAKVFAGAGVGMSMISAKSNGHVLANPNRKLEDKAKKKNNFAFALHLGASTEFAPGVNGELTYSYRDMGKFKKEKGHKSFGGLKGHHVAAGVRFDI
jgi:opacity protein-like surface antigen